MRRLQSPSRLLFGFLLFAGFRLSVIATEAPAAPDSQPSVSAEASIDLREVFPLPGAVEVSPDAPLRLRFAGIVSLGKEGKIALRDLETGAVVGEVNVATPTARKTIGGAGSFVYRPVVLDGREAHVQFANGILAYGRGYFVTVDKGVFLTGTGANASVERKDGWLFSTKRKAPPPDMDKIVVAADGSGDFCTVQGALDFVPEGNTLPRTILIRKGVYREIVFFAEKNNLTLLGEDRKSTVIAYANNAKLNTSGNPYGGDKPDPSAVRPGDDRVYKRGLFLAHRAEGLTLANLTFRNTTPQGGSQAEAIILNGAPSARAVLKDLDLFSYQDTLQINGQAYVAGCHIEGDVDFLWGTGPCFFEDNEFVTLRSDAYFTQIRNPPSNRGYVFLHCRFLGAPGVTGNYLSRIEPHRFPASEVVLLDCVLGPAVRPEGWQLQTKKGDASPRVKDLHFWEFHSRDLDGELVDSSKRHEVSRRLVMPQDKDLIESYKNPVWVLGGWNPKAEAIFAPNGKATAN